MNQKTTTPKSLYTDSDIQSVLIVFAQHCACGIVKVPKRPKSSSSSFRELTLLNVVWKEHPHAVHDVDTQ